MKKLIIKTINCNNDSVKLSIPVKLNADICQHTNTYALVQVIKQLNKQVKSLKKQLTALQKQVSCKRKE